MPTMTVRASRILDEYEQARTELVGKAAILTDGKAGTVESVWLDEMHGLRLSIRGHDGKWPVSTIKFAQTTV
ncbi:PRC-barrel domain containing protein [Bradyrhizobium sp. TZ2]